MSDEQREIQAELDRLYKRELPQMEHDARDHERIRKLNEEAQRRNGY